MGCQSSIYTPTTIGCDEIPPSPTDSSNQVTRQYVLNSKKENISREIKIQTPPPSPPRTTPLSPTITPTIIKKRVINCEQTPYLPNNTSIVEISLSKFKTQRVERICKIPIDKDTPTLFSSSTLNPKICKHCA